MEVREALDRISEIHAHLAKTEVYRGSRPRPVVFGALLGLLAAALSPRFVADGDPHGYLRYWIPVGLLAFAVSASGIARGCLRSADPAFGRRTRQVAVQLGASLGASLLVTIALARTPDAVGLLPGLWALLLGLGIWSLRPFAPRGTGWVAAFYVGAGALLLARHTDPAALSGWRLGGVFAVGQFGAALVLHFDLARVRHESPEEEQH